MNKKREEEYYFLNRYAGLINLRTEVVMMNDVANEIIDMKISLNKVESLLEDADTPEVDKLEIENWIAFTARRICFLMAQVDHQESLNTPDNIIYL